MMPTYALISGQPYGTSIFSVDVDDWHIRNIVPNYIERTFKGGFMKTGTDRQIFYYLIYLRTLRKMRF
jgi:hypothetical protein